MSDIKNKPKVSVIMAFYNVERFIEEAIRSVLNQSFTDFELIIINDGSPDNSFQIAQKYAEKDVRIVLINNEKRLGCASARNLGLNIAKGGCVVIFDSDDVCLPGRLAIQFEYLEKNQDIFLVGGSFYYINEAGEIIDTYTEAIDSGIMRKKLLKANVIHNPTVMFRNSGYRYRGKFLQAEDYDLWLRMLTDGKQMAVIKDIVVKYRIQKNSLTHKGRGQQKFYIKKARQYYYQRLCSGVDNYNDLILQNFSFKSSGQSNVGLMKARVVKLFFKNTDNMKDCRTKIVEFWRVFGLMIWPASIIFFVVSFLPQFMVNKFKKIIWKY